MERWQLKQMQGLPLDIKIKKTELRIREFYEQFNGDVYTSFSGGKDSTVLLDIARNIYPNIKGVYCDTGLEFPEIKEFVRTVDNIDWIRPKMNFKEVLDKYGYPVISKEQSEYIYEYRTAKSEKTRNTRLNGNKWGMGKISKKWLYMIDAPFKISDMCCDVMKKRPFHIYERKTKLHPIIGTMADESHHRQTKYLKDGCNSFDVKRPNSRPLSFWLESDIWEYLKTKNVPYSKIYDMGYERTGCMFCMFGCHMEETPNRFQKMQKTHPKQYQYCMNQLGLKEVLEVYGVEYENRQVEFDLKED